MLALPQRYLLPIAFGGGVLAGSAIVGVGCEALTWWNKAGGRVLRGLFERRKREQALCMQGL